jgi:hypothetical protein
VQATTASDVRLYNNVRVQGGGKRWDGEGDCETMRYCSEEVLFSGVVENKE